ncbi:MAG: UvrB/UvrC motif-containing protein [Bacillota bacterium]|jgi:protein arginine kinase activator
MLCNKCQSRTATVHIIVSENGQKQEQHLCDICAADAGHFNIGSELALHKFFPSFFLNEKISELSQVTPAKACSNCGLTYQQLVKHGKLGCNKCYDVFSLQLQPLLLKIHSADRHHGKSPMPSNLAIKPLQKKNALLESLRHQMAELVMEEKFEEAAIIRDKIRAIEKKEEADKNG